MSSYGGSQSRRQYELLAPVLRAWLPLQASSKEAYGSDPTLTTRNSSQFLCRGPQLGMPTATPVNTFQKPPSVGGFSLRRVGPLLPHQASWPRYWLLLLRQIPDRNAIREGFVWFCFLRFQSIVAESLACERAL